MTCDLAFPVSIFSTIRSLVMVMMFWSSEAMITTVLRLHQFLSGYCFVDSCSGASSLRTQLCDHVQ